MTSKMTESTEKFDFKHKGVKLTPQGKSGETYGTVSQVINKSIFLLVINLKICFLIRIVTDTTV